MKLGRQCKSHKGQAGLVGIVSYSHPSLMIIASVEAFSVIVKLRSIIIIINR